MKLYLIFTLKAVSWVLAELSDCPEEQNVAEIVGPHLHHKKIPPSSKMGEQVVIPQES